MREIELTQGYVALIDDEDYELVSGYEWHLHRDRNANYARTSVSRNGKRARVYMHRLIMDAPKGRQVDHIDHDALNNRRANLRMCTASQNQGNQRKQTGTSSQYKGVCWHKEKGKWHAKIKANAPCRHLGYFSDETDAARAYNDAARELFGEFAELNVIEAEE